MDSITKKCSKCNKNKMFFDFAKDIRYSGGIKGICKQCTKEYQKKRYKDNPEKAKKWVIQNPEKRKEIANKYYHTHKTLHPKPRMSISEKMEKARIRAKEWITKNPERRAEQQRNRRARKRNNGGTITAKEWVDLKAKYSYTCLCCGRKEPEIKITLDHVIPLALGGTHTIENAQPLCVSCNSSKQAKHIDFRR